MQLPELLPASALWLVRVPRWPLTVAKQQLPKWGKREYAECYTAMIITALIIWWLAYH